MLARYIAYHHHLHPDFLRGSTVIELVSGTGLVGIVAAMLEPDRGMGDGSAVSLTHPLRWYTLMG